MIRAIVFDLDGVMVQSEKLKAQAYALAVQQLRGLSEPDPRAVEAYRTIVGASREVAAQFVTDQLGLEPDLKPLMDKYGVSEPWQVLTEMRTAIYNEMVADPQVLRDNQWPHTVGLLRLAKQNGCRTGLATRWRRWSTRHAVASDSGTRRLRRAARTSLGDTIRAGRPAMGGAGERETGR